MGESEHNLRTVFASAQAFASSDTGKAATAVVFLDEVDVLCPRRDDGGAASSRLVAQLLTLLDGVAPLRRKQATHGGRVVVIAATNRPNALDAALRRPGRLDKEVSAHSVTGTFAERNGPLHCHPQPAHALLCRYESAHRTPQLA